MTCDVQGDVATLTVVMTKVYCFDAQERVTLMLVTDMRCSQKLKKLSTEKNIHKNDKEDVIFIIKIVTQQDFV